MSRQDRDAPKNKAQKIILGRITGVYGVKGWVKIFSYTDPMESIVEYSPWYIRPQTGKSGNGKSGSEKPGSGKPVSEKNTAWTRIKLKAGKRHAKTVVAKLEHCNNRDEAQAYIGTEIAIEPDQLEALEDIHEFYWRDLMGLRVINQQNVELGVVTNILETGANDVLVVEQQGIKLEVIEQKEMTEAGTDAEVSTGSGKKEHLIPWTMQQAIIAVDLEQGVIAVDWDPDF